MTAPHIKPGIYRHYKGQEYHVIGIAYHSETLEPMVVYKALYNSEEFGNNALWVRPHGMFVESVTIDETTVPRFTFVRDE